MTELTRKKPRRRGRRGGKGRRKLHRQAVPETPVQEPVESSEGGNPDIYDMAAEKREIDQAQAKHDEEMKTVNERLAGLLPLMLKPRDLTVLDWLCEVTKQDRATACIEMLRGQIVLNRRQYREAQGQISNTTTAPQPKE